MNQPTVFAVILAADVTSLAVAVLSLRRRPEPGSTSLAGLMVAVFWWSTFYGMEVAATSRSWMLFWANVQWFGVMAVPFAWFVFALEYTGRDEYVTTRNLALLAVVPVVTLVLVWTNDAHHLLRVTAEVDRSAGLVLLDQRRGPWFWVSMAYLYVLGLAGSAMFVEVSLGAKMLYWEQSALVVVAALVPVVTSAGYFAGVIRSGHLNPTPFAFAASGVLTAGAVTRFSLFESIPIPGRIARATVLEEIDDGVVVVDGRGRVVDANPAALSILGADLVGDDARSTVPSYVDLVGGDPPETVELVYDGSKRIYDVRATGVTDSHGRVNGHVIVLRDVTERRSHQQRLDVLNRVLRHNLRNEMNVVQGYASMVESYQPPGADYAQVIDERAQAIVELGDKAREIEVVLERASEERVDVDETGRDVVGWARETYPGVEFSYSPPVDAADDECPSVLEPVLRNLVENAARYNDGDSQRVSVDLETNGRQLCVVVEDDGPGIPDHERRAIESGSETPLEHGSGLGLWLVKWSVEEVGGTLSFEDVDAGTVARATIPCDDA